MNYDNINLSLTKTSGALLGQLVAQGVHMPGLKLLRPSREPEEVYDASRAILFQAIHQVGP